MVSSCVAIGCTYRHRKGVNVGLFRFPRDPVRHKMWIRAIKRKDFVPGTNSRICGKHFQTGRPSLHPFHPDYVPNIFDFSPKKKSSTSSREARKKLADTTGIPFDGSDSLAIISGQGISTQLFTRNNQARKQPIVVELSAAIVDTTNSASEGIEQPEVEEECLEEDSDQLNHQDSEEDYKSERDSLRKTNDDLKAIVLLQEYELASLRGKVEELKKSCACRDVEQASLNEALSAKDKQIAEYKSMVSSRDLEIYNLRAELLTLRVKSTPFAERVLKSDAEFSFYTGLHSKQVFDWLKKIMEESVREYPFNASMDTQLLIILMKLKLNLSFADIAWKLDVSNRTVGRVIDIWMPILASKLKSLIQWPQRRSIEKSLPPCFEDSIYKDTVAIIDCIEVLIQRPGNREAKNQTWMKERHQHLIKFLLSVTPCGYISLVSCLWGGGASSEEIILESGFLDYLSPLDIILANKEFDLVDNLTDIGAKLIIPKRTREAIRLPSSEHCDDDINFHRHMENIFQQTESDINVNIHMERVLDRIKRFEILRCVVPITFMRYMDFVVIICAALCNLSPGMTS